MKWIGCRLLMITVAAFLVLSNSPLRAQPDKMVLDSSKVSGEKQRPAVTFPHNRHVEIGLSCMDCHHFYQDGKNILDESKLEEGNKDIRCSACHGPKSRLNLQEAFHDQCTGCHKRYQKENKKTGPRYCGGCHIRIIK
jgi:c(7)-type cytochrome triheme protein